MKKRIRKVHLRTDKTDSGLACNSTVFTPLLTSDLDEVTCNCCIFTDIFKDAASEKEKERVAGGDELGNKPKNNIVKFNNVTVFKDNKHMEITGLNREQFNLLFDFLKKKSIGFSGTTDKTEIIPYIESYKTIIDFIKQDYNDLDEVLQSKTQLEKDTIKYNLSAEHVEILSKVDYEVVEGNRGCQNCLLKDECNDVACDPVLSKKAEKNIYFKQIHKTQKSLNESIKKEEVEKGIEEPYNIKESNIFTESMNELASNSIEPTKERFKETKEVIMSDKTEISINDGTPGKQLSCKFSKLSVGDYFLYAGSLCRKVLAIDSKSSTIEVISTGNLYDNSTSLFDSVLQNTVEMVEKVTIQYIRKEQ